MSKFCFFKANTTNGVLSSHLLTDAPKLNSVILQEGIASQVAFSEALYLHIQCHQQVLFKTAVLASICKGNKIKILWFKVYFKVLV